MNTKNILSWLLLIFGEAIIIMIFILLKENFVFNVLILNILISTFLFGLTFFNFSIPWIDLKDSTQKQIGAIGISWYTVSFYNTPTIVFMIIANSTYHFSFFIQIIVHSILLFFLFMWLILSRHSAEKVSEVYYEHATNRKGILEIKKAMFTLKEKISETKNLPSSFVQNINLIDESLRYLSPTENIEASQIEESLIKNINAIVFALNDYNLNVEQIENYLKKCERLYQSRKNLYSS